MIVPGLTSTYRDLRRLATQAWQQGLTPDVLPFCSDNGNYHFIDCDGVVGFWDHDDESEQRGGSLADWIVEVWLTME